MKSTTKATPKITIYTTGTCPYCVMLKRWLDERGVEFTDYRIDLNPYAAQAMQQISGQMGVPFSTVELADGTTHKILGFDREKFQIALA